MSKTNYANETKEKLNSIPDDNGFETVGGGGGIKYFYQYGPVKFPDKSPKARQIQRGDRIEGEYMGPYTYTIKVKGKTVDKTDYKIRTEDGMVSLSGVGQLHKQLTKVDIGRVVGITYLGKEDPTDDKCPHGFLIQQKKLAS